MSDRQGSERAERYNRELLAAIDRLVGEGWVVETQPVEPIPGIGDFRPDFVAKKGDEIIIGELKFKGDRDTSDLEQLARLVDALPKTTLDLTWLGEPPQIASQSDVLQMASDALRVANISASAALLLAWASLEGALQIYDRQAGLDETSTKPRPVSQVLADMVSLEDLSPSQFKKLIEASKLRNLVAHGSNQKVAPETVRYAAEVAIAISHGQFASIDGMVKWFHQFYVDPAHDIPFDSREGGYLYPPGEPHAVEPVLAEHFGLVPQEDVDAAAEIITAAGITEWVRRYRNLG